MATMSDAELSRVCGRGELEAQFQPIVDMATGMPVGAEALARWRRPSGDLTLPAAFIPALEQAGKMDALTRAMMCLALDAVAEWREAGHPCYVAVNITAEDLMNPEFEAEVARELIARDVPPSALAVEITERSIVGDPEQAVETIANLQAAGVRIALDDFGTGFSSLSHLVDLPVDAVKVDRRFVAAMTSRTEHYAIVQAVVDLAHRLDLKVVAEGVEDRDTLAALADLDADRAQGFLFARPTASEETAALFDELAALAGR